MSIPATSAPRILVVEADQGLQVALTDLLTEEGYIPLIVSSLEEALAKAEACTFALVLADLFAGRSPHSFTAAHILRRRVWPIPVGLLTTDSRSFEAAQQAGFGFVILMPFEIEHLLTLIAAALNPRFTGEQSRQAQTIKEFLQAIETADWKTLARLCTKDIIFYPPRQSPFASKRKVQGLGAYHDYVEAARKGLRNFHFHDVRIYPTPKGLTTRYLGAWLGADGSVCHLPGVVLVRFAGKRVRQIGASWSNTQRFREIQEQSRMG